MEQFLALLRRERIVRVSVWVITSLVLGSGGVFFLVFLSTVFSSVFAVKTYLGHMSALLLAHLIAMCVPWYLQVRTNSVQKELRNYLLFSLFAWMLTGWSLIYLNVYVLIQIVLWAETVGVIWQRHLKD